MGAMVRRTIPLLAVVWTATMGGAGAVAAAEGLTVTASSAQLGPEGTSVVLRGSYSCGPFASDRSDRGVIDLSIEQMRGGHTVRASGFLEPSICDGNSQAFKVTLTGTGRQRFRAGTGTWAASGMWKATPGCSTSRSPPLGSHSWHRHEAPVGTRAAPTRGARPKSAPTTEPITPKRDCATGRDLPPTVPLHSARLTREGELPF